MCVEAVTGVFVYLHNIKVENSQSQTPGPQETPGRGRGSKFKMCQDNRSPVAQAQNKANKVSQITSTVTISSTGINSLEVSSI